MTLGPRPLRSSLRTRRAAEGRGDLLLSFRLRDSSKITNYYHIIIIIQHKIIKHCSICGESFCMYNIITTGPKFHFQNRVFSRMLRQRLVTESTRGIKDNPMTSVMSDIILHTHTHFGQIEEQTVDEAISRILHDHHGSQEVVLKVDPSLVTILSSNREQVL